jgi:hypothetical protein
MHGATRIEPTDEDAILVNAWVVSDGAQEEFVDLVNRLFEYLEGLEGFIEGAVGEPGCVPGGTVGDFSTARKPRR